MTTSPDAAEPTGTSILDTLQSLLVAFVVAMTFRGFFVEGFVREYSHMDQKQFAAQVLHHHPKVSGAMFSIRAGKVDGFVGWLMQQNEKKFEEIFGE